MTSFRRGAAGSTLKWLSVALLVSGAGLISSQSWALDIHVTGLRHTVVDPPSGPLVDGTPPSAFAYVVNEDNTGDPFDPDPMQHPGVRPIASHSHVVAAGDQDHTTILGADGLALPSICYSHAIPPAAPQPRDCKYFISVRAPGYKLWGQPFTIDHVDGHVSIPRTAPLGPLTVTTLEVALIQEPLPLSNLVVKVFEDFAPVNGFPDAPLETATVAEGGTNMGGFLVVVEDIFGQVSVDYNGNPICGTGVCKTDQNGDLTIKDLGFGKYDVHVIPPSGAPQQWVQSSTFEGTRGVDAWLEEGTDGNGAPREILIEPTVQTAHFFAFTRTTATPTGSGTVTGRFRNYVEFPPFAQLALGQPVNRPWIAVNDIGNTDQMIARVRGNADGTFSINLQPGTYQLAVWDDPLDYIMAFYTAVVPPAGGTVAMGDLGMFRWFSFLSGTVFFDNDCTIVNGGPSPTDPDCGIRGAADTGIRGFDVDIRGRDGTVQYGALTDINGRYEYPEVISPLGKFLIGEVGFGRFGLTGQSVHDELCSNVGLNPAAGCPIANRTKVPGDLGGDLLTNQLLLESHRSIVDWGKFNYGTTQTGQIVGITFYDTTRNELDARLQAAEEYEPGIPGVLVRLWGLGADNQPNTQDDVLLNEYITDAWQHPSTQNGNGCDVRDKNGNTVPGPTPAFVADNCIEVPQLGNETRDGAFDGGYAFAATCPQTFGPGGVPILAGPTIVPPTARGRAGENVPSIPAPHPVSAQDVDGDGISNNYDTDRLLTDEQLETCETSLTPRDYVVQVVGSPYYQIVAEEDVNIDEGSALIPQVLPFPCVGDRHIVDDTGGDVVSPYQGQSRPLCDKRRVTLSVMQNANADFFLFTDMDTNPWTKVWHTEVSVPPAGRFYGLIEDDLDINTNVNSITYGEKRPVEGAPVGVRDYTFRKLITVYADENGFYEVMVPSTFTANCPIPNGVCTGMMVLTVNDPGDDPAHPDPNFRSQYLTEPAVFEVWPAHATATDTPIDPTETGAMCSPSVEIVVPDTTPPITDIVAVPEIVQVTPPYGNGGTGFSVEILGVDFGASTPSATLDGTPLSVSYFPGTGPVFVDRAVAQVPNTVTPGPHQLLLTNNDTHKTGVSGITIHVLGGGYNPPVVTVGTDYPTIQAAIDGAADNSLIIVPPATYTENVILWHPVKLQGYGPGAVVGSPESEAAGAVPPGEDPSTHIEGSVIDGRFFTFNQAIRDAWHARLSSLPITIGGPSDVAEGAAITVVAQAGAFGANPAFKPQIDGLGITAARGFAGGGVYVHAYGTNLQITNNIIDRNQSAHGGAVAIGRPVAEGGDPTDNNNDGIGILHNRMTRNGGVRFAGAVGIFNGAANYEIAYNDFCGNASSEYGGGISHFGLSDGGHIHHNRIYYNDAFDSGGGVQIAGDQSPTLLGLGSGHVTIEDNLIQANKSNDDGGGISLLRDLTYRIDVVNNIIANNVATDFGGGIFLDDSSNVNIVNNTVAVNVSTSTAEDADRASCSPPPGSGRTCPHGAGLLSESNSTEFQNQGGPAFSNPVLFNNIFWQNEAFYYDPTGNPQEPPLNLVSVGFIDLEVFGTPGQFSPRYSILTQAYPGANGTDLIGTDPLFVTQNETEVAATPNRLNPNEVIVEYLRITNLSGDYHVQGTSPAINQGTTLFAGINAPTDDFDGDLRTPAFDIGADEFSGVVPPPPPPPVVALLYFSTAGDVAIPGVPAGAGSPAHDNADIYKYDSAGNFSRVFDATAAGLAATANINALYFVPPPVNIFYMSFTTDAGTAVPGVGTVQDEDVVQYNANSGQFSMYFDGSDVGLGNGGAAEDVDAFTIVPGTGDVVVSTVGSAAVTGLAGTFPPQDLLRCSGGTRGASTTCTWSQYLDGSDATVGLTATAENIDGVTLFGSNILLSTTGAYSVPNTPTALSGTGSDVFVCKTATTGTASACTGYSRYFNGPAQGITNNIDAFYSTQDPTLLVVARTSTKSTASTTLVKAKSRH